MAGKFISEKNINFLLYDVFDVESLAGYEYYQDHNREMIDMSLKVALKMATNLLYPVFEEMDRKPPELVDGEVVVHPAVKEIMREMGQGGWNTTRIPFDRGGGQSPNLLADACYFMFQAANYSAAAFSGLTAGAARLIDSFGSQELYDLYVPKMNVGEWQGTMALTETEAGSSLADIQTTAKPTDAGYYLMSGQKVFISGGDHNCADNVIHLMLAKIAGAPAGVKGISLFVVPKKRIDVNEELVPNDLATSGVYHKLGYRGCPIVHLSMGDDNDCRGWLVGEPHCGLKYMFQLMNEARIGVGLGATAMATAAYYASLDYAKIRCQGRKLSAKDPLQPQVPIIEHADVKRMLLAQRAVVEGSLSLILQCSKYLDLMKVASDEEKQKSSLLLELLTPVAKSYPSEMGILSISQGLQCLGGSGFCDDFPLEQYYRDCRIHPIHEGTTGIQGMDLLGRKLMMEKGRAFELYQEQLKETITAAKEFSELAEPASQLEKALEILLEVTDCLMTTTKEKGAEYLLADATLYLEFFGIIVIAWQWLKQGVAVQKVLADGVEDVVDVEFYKGKQYTLRYFYEYELPKTLGLAKRLKSGDGLTVEMDTVFFDEGDYTF